jgi:glycosyltransferase involved in cell wall biosynthesis
LFILASHVEGFGLPIAEAIACDAAAICSGTSAMPEILDMDEACFDPSCPSSIASAIEYGLRDHAFRQRLIRRGRERRSLFKWPSVVDRLLAALGEMRPRAA